MKKSLPIAAVFCAVFLLPAARGRAQDLYVGSNAANVTSNFTSGTNLFNNTYVGYTTNATNNLLNVSGAGTVLTNTNSLIVGVDGRGNRLIVSNGGRVAIGEGSVGFTTNYNGIVTVTNFNYSLVSDPGDSAPGDSAPSVPAPGAAALVGMAGLITARRRKA